VAGEHANHLKGLFNSVPFLVVATVASRLPFLALGYGADGDAWRVAKSAKTLWHDGIYAPSRFPGFPLYEMINAPIIGPGGSLASNIATLIVFILAVLLFREIVRRMQIPSGNILVWTFAFMPILWKNSTSTMDYIWGLALLLLAYLVFFKGNKYAAALIIGLAAATRLTHCIFVLPLFFLLEKEHRWKTITWMGLTTAATVCVCYLPVILRPAYIGDLQFYIADIRHYTVLQMTAFFLYRGTYAFGLIGVLAIIALTALSVKNIAAMVDSRNRYFLVCITAIILFAIVFFPVADEKEYVIPVIPFLLILIGLVFRRKFVVISCVCLLSYSFINVDLIAHGFRTQRFQPAVTQGFVVKDHFDRTKVFAVRERFSNYPYADSSIVMIAMGPQFYLENPYIRHTSEEEKMFAERTPSGGVDMKNIYPLKDVSRLVSRPVYFVYAMSAPECLSFKKMGFHVFYIKESKSYIESCVGYDLDSVSSPIDISL
jgi:hypothetical protein